MIVARVGCSVHAQCRLVQMTLKPTSPVLSPHLLHVEGADGPESVDVAAVVAGEAASPMTALFLQGLNDDKGCPTSS